MNANIIESGAPPVARPGPRPAWTIRRGEILDLRRPVIMGIVNCTPDSFFDGGMLKTPEAACARGMELFRQGARILDVGGESTRPGAMPVEPTVELERVLPVIRGLVRTRTDEGPSFAVSVDTTKAGVAEAALRAGADIVNDVSACRFDPGLRDVLVQYQPGYVLMHSLGRPETMQKAPRYGNVVEDVLAFFEGRMIELVRAGLDERRIVLDPGIGFGKLLEHNLALLRDVERFFSLGRPVLVGLSNKSLWQGLLGLAVDARGVATQTATALLAARGVAVHRVHDAAGAAQALRIVEALAPGGATE